TLHICGADNQNTPDPKMVGPRPLRQQLEEQPRSDQRPPLGLYRIRSTRSGNTIPDNSYALLRSVVRSRSDSHPYSKSKSFADTGLFGTLHTLQLIESSQTTANIPVYP